jgi:exodeoxyribonuclease-5
MEIVLTPHQDEAKNKIYDLIRAGNRRILLKGSAGCGKTVLVAKMVEELINDRTIVPHYNNGHVFVTAPTNKALSVLQSKIHSPADFKTIHSALKLRRWVDGKTGEEKFIPTGSKYRDDDFPACRVCFIDEASMLSNKFIGGHTDEKGIFRKGYLDELNMLIIFIGDEKQLNPVKEEFSPAFHQNWPEVELTEIIRQGAGNPIIELSRNLDLIFFKRPKTVNGKGYVYDDNKAILIDNLAEANGTDELKYLSWANADVDEMNYLVRQRRYGRPRKIEKHETIVFNSPFGDFFTNQEVKVKDVDIIVDNIRVPRHDTKFDREMQPISATDKIKIKYYRINDAINVIHEDSTLIFNEIYKSIKVNCERRGWDFRGKVWFYEQFADIKYNHALTIHKSQGSTYKQTIVNIENVMYNKNAHERTRMLYTAITRASDLLILNKVK